MPKLTKEQFEKWSNQAANGFVFDTYAYCIYGEKSLIRKIKQEDGCIIEHEIKYTNEIKPVTNSFGCIYNDYTGRFIPTLSTYLWKPGKTEGVYVMSKEKNKQLGEPQDKKKYSVLCELSKTALIGWEI